MDGYHLTLWNVHIEVFSLLIHVFIHYCPPTKCLTLYEVGNKHLKNLTIILFTDRCIFFPFRAMKKPVQILAKWSITLLMSVNVYSLLTVTIQPEGFIREAPYCSRDCIFCEKEILKSGINLTKLNICSD